MILKSETYNFHRLDLTRQAGFVVTIYDEDGLRLVTTRPFSTPVEAFGEARKIVDNRVEGQENKLHRGAALPPCFPLPPQTRRALLISWLQIAARLRDTQFVSGAKHMQRAVAVFVGSLVLASARFRHTTEMLQPAYQAVSLPGPS